MPLFFVLEAQPSPLHFAQYSEGDSELRIGYGSDGIKGMSESQMNERANKVLAEGRASH
jgi:hypothetical protein